MSSDDGDDIHPDECDSCGSVIDGEHAATSDICWDCRQASDARIATLEADLARVTKERDRLLKLFDDAGQGEHNVLALVDYYQDQALTAGRERDALKRTHYVRHQFARKSNKCARCGVRRRWHTSGWTWQSQSGDYSHSNPPCAFRPVRP